MLLRAWPEVRRRTGARLRIAGADPLAVRLLLTRLRVPDDGIDVLGFLTQEELTAELARAKALAAPSLGGESFGMVLTRAFACATPVVASDIAGYRDVMTPETSVAVPPGDPPALADALVALARGRAAPRRARRRGRELAIERYSWDDIARRLAAIYEARHGQCRRGRSRREDPRTPRLAWRPRSCSRRRCSPRRRRCSGGAGRTGTSLPRVRPVNWAWVVGRARAQPRSRWSCARSPGS